MYTMEKICRIKKSYSLSPEKNVGFGSLIVVITVVVGNVEKCSTELLG